MNDDPQIPATVAMRRQRLILLAALLLLLWLALRLFAAILLPFVLSGFVAYFLDPPVRRMTAMGMPRGIAALVMLLALMAAVLLFVLLLYPLIMAQLGIMTTRLPAYVTGLQTRAATLLTHLQAFLGPDFVDSKLRDLVSSQAGSIISFVSSTLKSLLGSGFALFNTLSLLVVTPVVSFYLLRDWPKIIATIDGWLPRRSVRIIRAQAVEVDRILSAWVRGQAFCCVILAVFYAVGLSVVGLDLGLLVGLMSGLLSFIPYVGSIIGEVTALSLGLAQFPNWHGVALVVVVFILGQLLEGYVIYPRFLGDRVELHAVTVIFALFAGGAAFGFLGVLLAVPAAAAIGVLARFWLRRYQESPLYLETQDPR